MTLRLLSLHGFRGSGAGQRAQLAGLLAGCEERVELLCPDAPAAAHGGFGWWNAQPIEGASPRVKHYEGWARTRAWVLEFFAQHGPIDGVLGFSQGAALTALLVGMRAAGQPVTAERPLSFDFAVLVSGFASNDPVHAPLFDAAAAFSLPSLHLIGRADRIVPSSASLSLAERFAAPTIVLHDGGHVIPSTAEARIACGAFLAKRERGAQG